MAKPGACSSWRNALLKSASRGYLRGEGIAFLRSYRCTLHATGDKMIPLKSNGFVPLVTRTTVHRQSKLFESGQGPAWFDVLLQQVVALCKLRSESFHCCILASNLT